MMEVETISCIPTSSSILPLSSAPRSSTPITKTPSVGLTSPRSSTPPSETTEESSPNTSTGGFCSPVNFALESRGNNIPFNQPQSCIAPINCHKLPNFETAKMIIDASNHEQMDMSSDAECTTEKEKIAIAAITDLSRQQQNGVHMDKMESRSFPAVPEMSPTTSGDGENDRTSSPASSEPTQEKQRSRRKPSLEDIVRRMKPTDDCFYTDDESDEEELNGSLSIDMARRTDEVDGSVDVSMIHTNPVERKDIPENTKNIQSESVKTEKHANVNDFSDSKENLPAFPNGSLPPSFPLASNISETAFSPSLINKHWFNGSFNGLPMFPFPPSQMDPSMVHKFLPFDNKLAAEVEKDYLKCQYCERTFRRQKNLENHIENTHHGKSPVRRKPENGNSNDMYFKCTHCPYTTKHQSNLYVHIRIHTGERPYICGACGVQYSQSHSLKSHIINKHDGIMSYYIKEKRTRSPRGMGYLANTMTSENNMFKLPPPLLPHGIPGLPHNFDLNKSIEMMRNTEQMVHHQSPHLYTKLPFMNGHASPNYGDVPANRSPGSFQMPANAQMTSTPVPQQPPAYHKSSSPAPLTPNNSINTKKQVNGGNGECGAIDLSKKTDPQPPQEKLLAVNKEKAVNSTEHQHALCANCLYAPKLKMLRLNVVKMLSILVPNLNFEEKGISADSDSVDELLQDVIESNTHEEDMTAE